MAFAKRAIPAEETDIIAKTVIHPNIAFTSTHLQPIYSSSREIQSKGLSFHSCYSKGLPNGRRELAEWHSVLPAVLRQKFGGVNESAPCFGMTEMSLFFFGFLLVRQLQLNRFCRSR